MAVVLLKMRYSASLKMKKTVVRTLISVVMTKKDQILTRMIQYSYNKILRKAAL